MRNLPNKVEPIKPNYHEDDAIAYLERYFDEWTKTDDWWYGDDTWDLNVFTYHQEEDYEGSEWTIAIYPLVKYDDDELLHIDTSTELDLFELKL